MNPFRWSFRTQYLVGGLACLGLVGYAIFTQLHDGLEPCPLCIFQRLAFMAVGVIFLLGGMHSPRGAMGRRAYALLTLLASAVGIGIAGRHVWLQHLPIGAAPSCGPPLSFMRETMGPMEVIKKVLTGSGDCGAVDWSFLGLAMPAWSLVWFVLLALWALYAGFCRRRSSFLK
ncbi:MAG: disulfide bond formation protein B [Xanthomonadaceae bacterium]|jgi:disulfide bond formation protein DsbB|nr:disulfide bond formation protein B [Xanthomonadaceae bacterium]